MKTLSQKDRTSELRKKGFPSRRLGPVQMTTDTAVRVARMVVESKIPLDKIPHVDFPELKLNRHETTEMPFRYVTDEKGNPIMPDVSQKYQLHASPKLSARPVPC